MLHVAPHTMFLHTLTDVEGESSKRQWQKLDRGGQGLAHWCWCNVITMWIWPTGNQPTLYPHCIHAVHSESISTLWLFFFLKSQGVWILSECRVVTCYYIVQWFLWLWTGWLSLVEPRLCCPIVQYDYRSCNRTALTHSSCSQCLSPPSK